MKIPDATFTHYFMALAPTGGYERRPCWIIDTKLVQGYNQPKPYYLIEYPDDNGNITSGWIEAWKVK